MGNPIGTNSHLQVEAIKTLDRITKLPVKITTLSSDSTGELVKSAARQNLVQQGGIQGLKHTYAIRPGFCSITVVCGTEEIPVCVHDAKLTRDAIRKCITEFRTLYAKDGQSK